MRKRKRKQMRKGSNCCQSKTYCKLSLAEHAALKELLKQSKQSKKSSFEAKWLQFLNPQVIYSIVEIFKAMF